MLKTLHIGQHSVNRLLEVALLVSCDSSNVGCELMKGTKNSEVPRARKDLIDDIFIPLGHRNFRRAYRMTQESFFHLHDHLEESLLQHFFPKQGGKRSVKKCSYLVDTG